MPPLAGCRGSAAGPTLEALSRGARAHLAGMSASDRCVEQAARCACLDFHVQKSISPPHPRQSGVDFGLTGPHLRLAGKSCFIKRSAHTNGNHRALPGHP